MHNSKPTLTPLPPNLHSTTSTPLTDAQATSFRQTIGSLQYLSLTRPDITYSINYLSRYMHNPSTLHHQLLKRTLRYLNGTRQYGIPLAAGDLHLRAYSDADWATDPDDRKSITGTCLFLGGSLVSWSAKKQPTVARSSAEAEYRAIATIVTDVLWARKLLSELLGHPLPSTPIYSDNTAAISIAHNPIFQARTKHIEVDLHFIRQHLKQKEITSHYIMTQDQLADFFTKSLSAQRHNELRSKLTIRQADHQLAGGSKRNSTSHIATETAQQKSQQTYTSQNQNDEELVSYNKQHQTKFKNTNDFSRANGDYKNQHHREQSEQERKRKRSRSTGDLHREAEEKICEEEEGD